uniref:Uncharacterized protein n=1 Tax=Trypanosoma congolense (strain IL3000) TaxID=1068625 RepID=G0UTZ0_TRYCI|nr:conserved hypothetical protein [Trypanosoma congolense IL3000]
MKGTATTRRTAHWRANTSAPARENSCSAATPKQPSCRRNYASLTVPRAKHISGETISSSSSQKSRAQHTRPTPLAQCESPLKPVGHVSVDTRRCSAPPVRRRFSGRMRRPRLASSSGQKPTTLRKPRSHAQVLCVAGASVAEDKECGVALNGSTPAPVAISMPLHSSPDVRGHVGTLRGIGVTRDDIDGRTPPMTMSQKGLSVYAAPFLPSSKFPAHPPLSSLMSCGIVDHATPPWCEKGWSSLNGGSADALENQGAQEVKPQFPRTPVAAGDVARCRFSTRLGNAPEACVSPSTPLGDDSDGVGLQRSVGQVPPLPSFDSLRRYPVLRYSSRCGSSTGGNLCTYDEKGDGESGRVRHLRVPFTDAEALDEAKMLDMLQGSDDSNEEGAADRDEMASAEHLWQHCAFGSPITVSSSVDLCHFAGGYWDVNGPSVAPQRFLRQCTPSISSLNVDGCGDGSSSIGVSRGEVDAISGAFPYDNDDVPWELSSSAYADSLDEEQLEWIEQQLRAK